MKAFYTLIFLLFIPAFYSMAIAQSADIELQNIEVDISHDRDIIAIHTIQKGQTLYSIAKFYKIPLQNLMDINNIKPGQVVSLDSEIKVPINNEFIDKSGTKADPSWIPVTYTIKKKETLYTIGKKYFSQEIEDLNKRNDINSFIIHENERLIVGWWSPSEATTNEELTYSDTDVKLEQAAIYNKEINTTDSSRVTSIQEKAIQIAESIKKNDKPTRAKLQPLDPIDNNRYTRLSKIYNPDSDRYITIDSSYIAHGASDTLMMIEDPRVRINKKGICLWMKNDPETTQLLAFHKTAKVGSNISILYPLTNRTVEVTVIDNIKPNLYPDDVEIIVTKAVALELGARDSRIQINMDYYQ